MFAFTVRRLLASVPVMLVSSFLVFLLVASTADPMAKYRQHNPPLSPATLHVLAHRLRVDQPILHRYWTWLTSLVLHGSWGPSVQPNVDIGQELSQRILVTLRLIVAAIIISLLLAVIVGVVSAVKQYSKLDYSATLVGFLFLSLPTFWFAVLLKYGAIELNNAVGHQVLFTASESTAGMTGSWWQHMTDDFGHLVLPTVSLALTSYAAWSRFQRASMLDVLNSDYMRLARAKGLSQRRVMIRHGLRTALIPMSTQVALDVAVLLGGAIVTETVYNWQGLGNMFLTAVTAGDTYTLMAWLVFASVAVILFNLLADLLYAVLDPRIRLA